MTAVCRDRNVHRWIWKNHQQQMLTCRAPVHPPVGHIKVLGKRYNLPRVQGHCRPQKKRSWDFSPGKHRLPPLQHTPSPSAGVYTV